MKPISFVLGFSALTLACASSEQAHVSTSSNQKVYRFVHWNIKELDSVKIAGAISGTDRKSKAQLESAAALLQEFAPDLLSVNEIHYDNRKRTMPSAEEGCDFSVLSRFNTYGGTELQNFDYLLERAYGEAAASWNTTFCPANTGARALPGSDGRYFSSRPSIDKSKLNEPRDPTQPTLDTVNFGWLPGQYSTGFATPLPITSRFVNANITWHEWDPTFDFTSYDLGFAPVSYTRKIEVDGQLLDQDLEPSEYKAAIRAINQKDEIYKTYELFDKNFNISMVDVGGRPLAVITLHTVPAFGFDLERFGTSPNPERNKAQLEFLEWVLFGNCEPDSPSKVKRCETNIKPLEGRVPFIATGDLNVAIDHPSYPGAKVMQRILTNPKSANAHLTDRRFGLPIIPEANLPSQVLERIRAGTLTPADFANFNQETTFIPEGFDWRGRGRSKNEQLDYFIVSADLDIKRLEIYFPQPEFQDFGCLSSADAQAIIDSEKAKGRAVDVRNTTASADGNRPAQTCVKSGTAAYGKLREASDHLPLILEFTFR